MRISMPLAAAVGLLLVGCGSTSAPPHDRGAVTVVGAAVQRQASDASDAEVRALARAQLEFAADLYRAVEHDVDGDLVLGPGSLHTVLAMVAAGARGQTAAEIAAVLHTEIDEQLHEAGNALDAALRSRNDAAGVDLTGANAVWADDDVELLDEYAAVLATSYGAAPVTLDISGDPEAARRTVNAWVAEATEDKVEELFARGTMEADTRLVLANAVHLDAQWMFPFDPAHTTDAPFQLGDGSTVEVPTMRYDDYLPSGRGRGWTAVRLPYGGGKLSMTVIVPEDLSAFEQRLDADLLDEVDGAIKDGGIHLSLPRFSARRKVSLAETLDGMGMPTAFGSSADFSGMTGADDLTLGAVEHEAVIEVDEDGTRAAAASGAVMRGSHGPTVDVDRPFLFVVRDEDTRAVLFLGRVLDPR
jgi:serpin B